MTRELRMATNRAPGEHCRRNEDMAIADQGQAIATCCCISN